MTSILIIFASKITLLQLFFFLDASFAKYKSCLLAENFEENLVKNFLIQ